AYSTRLTKNKPAIRNLPLRQFFQGPWRTCRGRNVNSNKRLHRRRADFATFSRHKEPDFIRVILVFPVLQRLAGPLEMRCAGRRPPPTSVCLYRFTRELLPLWPRSADRVLARCQSL